MSVCTNDFCFSRNLKKPFSRIRIAEIYRTESPMKIYSILDWDFWAPNNYIVFSLYLVNKPAALIKRAMVHQFIHVCAYYCSSSICHSLFKFLFKLVHTIVSLIWIMCTSRVHIGFWTDPGLWYQPWILELLRTSGSLPSCQARWQSRYIDIKRVKCWFLDWNL